MTNKQSTKTGIHAKKPIVCSRCGKKVGWVTIKKRFQWKLIWWGLVFMTVTQIIAEIVGRWVFGDYS